MVSSSTFSRLAPVAEEQWGLITRRQAQWTGACPATMQRLAAAGVLNRVAHGVYRLAGSPVPDHLALRAAWLQLAPGVPAWKRTPAQGMASHRSAAVLYGLGQLPADRHDFTLAARRQSRRSDVRLHQRAVRPAERAALGGLPVTRPARIVADLLDDQEAPEAVAVVAADAIRAGHDNPGTVAECLAPYAARFELGRGDGLALFRWLLDLSGDSDTTRWTAEARAYLSRRSASENHQAHPPVEVGLR
jgi:predicted transcriptional regulator of viral defense system